MNSRLAPIAIASTVLIPGLAMAQTVSFELIPSGNTALDMTPDGRYIVGGADTDGNGFQDGTYIYDTTTGVTTILPGPGVDVTAVSDDGTVLLGCMPDPGDGVEVAGMYTEADGWMSLGWLPASLNCPSRSNGYDLSGDGTIATGLSWDGCSGRAYKWTAEDGMQELEAQANGGNRGTVISNDGTVVGGFAQGSFSRTPATWNTNTLLGDLLDPPNGDVVGEVQGMRDDASVLLGNWDGDAYTWTESDGMQTVGAGSLFPTWVGYAMDIAENDTIVGFDGIMTSRIAWIKPAGETELVNLINYINDNGGSVPPGTGLGVCTRISADGTLIAGHTFFQSAWIVRIEFDSCEGDLNDSGAVDVDDLLTLVGSWGTDGAGADLAKPNDIVDVNDLLVILGAWGPCP